MKIDLHMHSTASDGKLSPEELVDLAVERGLKVIAVTDHEVVEGCVRAIQYAKGKDLEVVSGIEIGADDEEVGFYDVHIIGLFLDLGNVKLLELSDRLMGARAVQKREMIGKLNELGYEITFDELKVEAGGVNYGRPHIARILMRKYPGEFAEFKDVFDRLLGASGLACVRQWKDSLKNTIDIIHGAGGIAILAHPMFCPDVLGLVDRFVECEGDGMEVDYFYGGRNGPSGAGDEIERACFIAADKGLLVSGGGDFHSFGNGFDIGDYGVSEIEFETLREGWKSRGVKNFIPS